MTLTKEQKREIEEKLKDSIQKKLKKYSPEPAYMPFHTRLLGKDKLSLYSFIHSLNTNFGKTIFEPISAILAREKFKTKLQETAGSKISSKAQNVIQEIMNELTSKKERQIR